MELIKHLQISRRENTIENGMIGVELRIEELDKIIEGLKK